jgi:hypothetical protein
VVCHTFSYSTVMNAQGRQEVGLSMVGSQAVWRQVARYLSSSWDITGEKGTSTADAFLCACMQKQGSVQLS